MRYLEKRGFLCRQKFESLRDEKDHEIFNLREGSQKLQVQLNNGFSGFKDFKEKKAKEIQSLQAQIEDLSKVKCHKIVSKFSNSILFLQSDQNEALETLEKQLQESKSELEEIQTEKSRLTEELEEYVRKLNNELQAKGVLKHELEAATKVNILSRGPKMVFTRIFTHLENEGQRSLEHLD